LDYLERVRWGDGFVCPRCGTVDGAWWAVRRGLRKCAVCHHETSVTAGTIFHGSRLPLTSWSRRSGTSSTRRTASPRSSCSTLEWPELHDEAMRDIGLALKAPTVAAAGSAPAGRDRLHVDPAKLRAAILAPCASA
jgi:Transposase zinc-ribbon domain